MGDFTSFLSNLRLRRLGEASPATPVQPELGSLEEPDFLEDGPATQEYQEHIRAGAPDPSLSHPGPVKGILAALAGALTGFGENSALAGATAGRSIIEAPHQRALESYTQKAKSLGALSDDELARNKERRLFRDSELDRKERAVAAKLRADTAANRPGRTFKPEALRDKFGVLTGEMIVYGPDGPEKIEVPDIKGSRTTAESPTTLQGRNKAQRLFDRTKELKDTLDRVTKKTNWPVIGSPHVGRGQGMISEALTSAGFIDDPDVINLHQLAREIANETLYTMSGAQINNKEYERLRRTLPDTNKSEAQIRADIERALKFQEAALQGLISENDVDWTPESGPTSQNSNPAPFPTGTPSASPRKPLKITRR